MKKIFCDKCERELIQNSTGTVTIITNQYLLQIRVSEVIPGTGLTRSRDLCTYCIKDALEEMFEEDKA